MTIKQYMLHPGFVISANDGDKHFIGTVQLQNLYGVATNQCVVADSEPALDWESFVHLWPRRDGDYSLQAQHKEP